MVYFLKTKKKGLKSCIEEFFRFERNMQQNMSSLRYEQLKAIDYIISTYFNSEGKKYSSLFGQIVVLPK